AGDVCAEVGDHAFRKAPFTNVTLPASLKTFGSNCFDEMENLTEIDATAYEGRPAAASTQIWGTTHADSGIIYVAEGQTDVADNTKVGWWFANSGFGNLITAGNWVVTVRS
ncbi:MAG: leucine-rich repeat protein, partial [Mycoplasma sp.]|nr:leucine-rich repeat protein [Candidatus Hennigella equi]